MARRTSMKIAVIHGGTISNGNTETLAELALKGLAADRIFLKDYTGLWCAKRSCGTSSRGAVERAGRQITEGARG